MTNRAQQWTQRILDALHREGRQQYGAITRAERRVKRASGYLRGRRKAGTIDLPHCLAFIEALDLHPARFFRHVFPFTEDVVACYVDPPRGAPPAIIERARERLADSRPPSISRTHLLDLDGLRYDRPLQAAQATFEAIPFLDHTDISFALGVWGSSQKRLLELDSATHALHAGMEIAKQRRDDGSLGDLLQRTASVVGDYGDYGGAFSLSREATDRHLLAGDMVAVARTFVDRGRWLYYLERYHEAIAMQERALSELPKSERRHRCAAFQCLGWFHQTLGDLDLAQHYSEQAIAEGVGLGAFLTGKQTWLQASICFDRGDYHEAETLLKEVTTVFADIHAGERALATIDLAEVQLKADKPADAYFSAQAILPLITPLGPRNRIVRAAEHALRELASRGADAMSKAVR